MQHCRLRPAHLRLLSGWRAAAHEQQSSRLMEILSGKSCGFRSCAKNGRANAHQRGAFLNRNLEIAGHAHGKLTEIKLRMLGGQLVAQFTERPEAGPRCSGFSSSGATVISPRVVR